MHAGVDRHSHWGRLERQVYEVKAWRLLMSAELRKGRIWRLGGSVSSLRRDESGGVLYLVVNQNLL